MSSYLRLLPLAVFGAVALGCAEEAATVPPSSSRSPAREIAGVDGEGNPLALSDFRGKVVLVDFWKEL
jgi:hypothetical protein